MIILYKQTNEYVFDRIYDGIKYLVISHQVPPGARLNIEKLAIRFDVSTTPVREVLNRLVARDLIEIIPKMGFFTKHLSETELRDILDLNRLLLNYAVICLKQAAKPEAGVTAPGLRRRPDFPSDTSELSAEMLTEMTANLFDHMAEASGNMKLVRHIQTINDQLRFTRLREYASASSMSAELARLHDDYRNGAYAALQNGLATFHANRAAFLPRLIRDLILHPPPHSSPRAK